MTYFMEIDRCERYKKKLSEDSVDMVDIRVTKSLRRFIKGKEQRRNLFLENPEALNWGQNDIIEFHERDIQAW